MPKIRWFVAILLLLAAPLSGPAWAETQSASAHRLAKPVPALEHVIVISIDGGRPDLLLRANCPSIRSLMADGSYTFWARTTAVAITLPSHVSMMTGVIPVRHGIHWNEDLPLAKPYYPKVPTIFELAHQAGYTTALVSAKGKFDVFARPGALDWAFIPGLIDPSVAATQPMEKQSTARTVATDDTVTNDAIRILSEHHPDVMMIHYASSDVAGHAKGWGSPEQMAAFEHIDAGIGRVLHTLDSLGLRAHTAVIVTADHGGAGRTHGADDPRSRHIPWIIAGPGIRKNLDLTSFPDLEVNTYDTFSTACWLMGIKVGYKVDGKPVQEILEDRQLLQ